MISRVAWHDPGTAGIVRRWIAGEHATEVFTAKGPGNPSRDLLPMLVARRRGGSALFRVVIEPVASGEEGAVPSTTASTNNTTKTTSRGLTVTVRGVTRSFELP